MKLGGGTEILSILQGRTRDAQAQGLVAPALAPTSHSTRCRRRSSSSSRLAARGRTWYGSRVESPQGRTLRQALMAGGLLFSALQASQQGSRCTFGCQMRTVAMLAGAHLRRTNTSKIKCRCKINSNRTRHLWCMCLWEFGRAAVHSYGWEPACHCDLPKLLLRWGPRLRSGVPSSSTGAGDTGAPRCDGKKCRG